MKTVLLVEDESNQRLLYRMELEEDGYRVLEASNGQQAIAQVNRSHPDVVVLDLHMPGLDGVSTLSMLKELDSRLPVVVYSAYEAHRQDRETWVADAYVVKSSDPNILTRTVNQLMESAPPPPEAVSQN
jgi:CheY-like chemotaxis protein